MRMLGTLGKGAEKGEDVKERFKKILKVLPLVKNKKKEHSQDSELIVVLQFGNLMG